MFGTWREHFQALYLRTPLQDIDIDVAHTPAVHVETARLVEIDRFGSHERSVVVVNYIFFVCIGDSEPGAEREAGPIGSGAHHMVPRKRGADSVVGPTFFGMRIGSGTHFWHAMPADEGRLRLRRTANDQARDNSCNCKVKALRHLQYRALNSNWSARKQAIILGCAPTTARGKPLNGLVLAARDHQPKPALMIGPEFYVAEAALPESSVVQCGQRFALIGIVIAHAGQSFVTGGA